MNPSGSDVAFAPIWTNLYALHVSYYISVPFAASGGYFYNTAWSAALNRNGERILTQESEIVTAHEFGHNWGNKTISLADPRGAWEVSPGQFSFHFHAVFEKMAKIIGWRPHLWDWRSTSWIRHWSFKKPVLIIPTHKLKFDSENKEYIQMCSSKTEMFCCKYFESKTFTIHCRNRVFP